MIEKIGIMGAGAWGTALALTYQANAKQVVLWTRQAAHARQLHKNKENQRYLTGFSLPATIQITANASDLADCAVILLVIPAQHLREQLSAVLPMLGANKPLVICTKGIERTTLQLMPELVAEVAPDSPQAVLSGPNLSSEVAAGLPAAATLACKDAQLADQLIKLLALQNLRLYLSDDLLGVALAGAVKNVFAIACGIASGLGYGENTRAALITRGIAEMVRCGVGFGKGIKTTTFMGLAGCGDLILTATSEQSRNFSLGKILGQGQRLTDILASRDNVTEGVASTEALVALADQLSIEMPITQAVQDVLTGKSSPASAANQLLARPLIGFTKD